MKVRDVMKKIERDGWVYIGTKGSHRQYKHPAKKVRLRLPAIHRKKCRPELSGAC
jgi:predicted RNA binding protein YcfA (HicA-like mRNA interferase family)